MNPLLESLQPYPFEKLKKLLDSIVPNVKYRHINLSIGEPQHPTPTFIKQIFIDHLSKLAKYPNTIGTLTLRQTIAKWLERRYKLPKIDPITQVLPVNGSREALFSFTQTVINTSHKNALVACPHPFYQIYEGSALLAGVKPYYIHSSKDNTNNFIPAFHKISNDIWKRVQLLFVCSPNNPTGAVLSLADWKILFNLSDLYGFIIASDECYSEIYFEKNAPLGGLEAAHRLNRIGYPRLIVFSSLSKRSNVPGMRSGFVAGDKTILKKFLLYRTYHGSAMSLVVQKASIAAWNDEAHVQENRNKYTAKFKKITPLLKKVLDVSLPDAGFYLWARINKFNNISDTEYTKRLYAQYNVTVLPGSYLKREFYFNEEQHIRIALVPEIKECLEATKRIVDFTHTLKNI